MDKRIGLVVLIGLLLVGWLWWSREDVSLVAPATPDASRPVMDAASASVAEAATIRPEATVDRVPVAADAAAVAKTSEADVEPTGELLVRVVWPDEAPAPGIHVYLARSVPGASRPLAEIVSNEAGEARARLAAGKVLVTSDRGGRGKKELVVDVVAGERHEVVLQLPAGVDVEGSVCDGAGAPVPGAAVWLSSPQSPWCAGAFVGESGLDGTFRLRAVPKDQSLGAVAKGYSPAKLVDLDLLDTKQSPVKVSLVLGDAGGALAGRVADEQGKPVVGAIVAVGEPERRMNHRSGNSFEENWSPRRAVTGDDGRYVLEGLQCGEQPVEAFGREFAFWHGKVAIVPQQTAQLDVTLSRGVTVFGTVTGEDGKPVAGACVRCFPRAIETPYLQGGQYDYESTFGCPFAIADEAGRYRLWGAAPPELHLYASQGGYRRGDDSVCWADEVLRGEPGAVVEWNAKVDPGLAIRGVVRYRDGVPMAGVFVSVIEPGTKNRQALNNDKHGRFRFVRLQKKAYDVSVQVWDPPKGAPPVEAREVWPETGELVIEAAFDSPKKLANGSVRGAVSDAAGRLSSPSALAVILASDRGWNSNSKLEGGAFHFTDIEPGRRRVIVMSGEDPILYGPWIELQPAENKDVGTLVTEPGGKLVLHVVRGPGTEALEPTIYVSFFDGGHGRKAELAKNVTELTFDNLCVGEYRLSSYCKGMASIREGKCTVTAGAAAKATIELRAAVEREIVVEYTAAQRITHIRVQGEGGGEVFDYKQPRAMERPYRMKLQLPLGRFTFLVETEGGGRAETTFPMTSLAEGQGPVVLQAR